MIRLSLFLAISALSLGNVHVFGSKCTCDEFSSGNVHIICDPGSVINAASLKNCTDNPWRVVSLTVLSGDNNGRSIRFDEDAFSVFRNLESITLSFLSLRSLPTSSFAYLGYLTHIDLSSNNITDLPIELFSAQLETLRSLNISHNMLTNLTSDFLSSFTRLETIDLSDNRLTTLPSEVPVNWPTRFKLLIDDNLLAPCWSSVGRIIGHNESWWCNNYSVKVNGIFQEDVKLPCNGAPNSTMNGIILWRSPKNHLYTYFNGTKWKLSFVTHPYPSVVYVSSNLDSASLHIDGMRPYFIGVWSCLMVQSVGNQTFVKVLEQVLLVCRSKIRDTYHWSLIVSAVCTAAMIITGLLSALIRLLWATRCFTRKVHLISALSLHDLQYSPRLSEQRIKILRNAEMRARAIADDPFTSAESVIPAWLPPHRQRNIDPFAHGGYPFTDEEEEYDSMLDGVGLRSAPSTSPPSDDDELGEMEEEDEDDEGDESQDTLDEHGLRSRVDELRERFRRDMVKRVDHVRSRMRESRHSVEESIPRVMKSLRSGGSVAASKMRSGLYNSVESVKFQMRSVTEFCGAKSVGIGQTVSVTTLDTDVDTQTTERRIVDVTAV